jgi:hypothetical protein
LGNQIAEPPTPRYRRRRDASAYLRERWGLSYAPAKLAKYASIGGGPRFVHDNGRIPLYPRSALDEWARSRLSVLKSSTSDPGHDPRVEFADPPTPSAGKATPVEALEENARRKIGKNQPEQQSSGSPHHDITAIAFATAGDRA